MPRCLGRIKPHPAKLASLRRMADVAPQLPDPPSSVNYSGAKAGAVGPVYQGMLANDEIGDCTVAGKCHLIQGWAACLGGSVSFTDAMAVAEYSRLSGYDPATGAGDTGMDETVVMTDWANHGTPMPDGSTNVVRSWCVVSPQDIVRVKQTIWCFGGIYLGLDLPRSAEEQSDAHQPWTKPWWSTIVGGHCVVASEYDEDWLYVSTWNTRQPVAWDFVQAYFDAAYAAINPLWLDASGRTPGKLTAADLEVDERAVAG